MGMGRLLSGGIVKLLYVNSERGPQCVTCLESITLPARRFLSNKNFCRFLSNKNSQLSSLYLPNSQFIAVFDHHYIFRYC